MTKYLSILLLILVVAGIAIPVGAQDTTEITFWTFVDIHADYMQQRAEEWNAANPDRQIELVPTVIGYQEMHDTLLLNLLSGTGAPDMVDIEFYKWNPFLKGDIQFHPLNDIVDPVIDTLVASRMVYQRDGQIYGIDYHVGTFVMFYNTEILEEAGVDVNSIVTWDDYIAAGQAVTNENRHMAAIETIGNCFPLRALMLQKGGGTYDADGNFIIESEANVEALQFYDDLVNEYGIAAVTPGGQVHDPATYEAFVNGDFASLWMPQWYMTRFYEFMPDLEDKMVVRAMPVFDEEGTFSTGQGGGTGTAITNQIPDDELQLAKDFLAFAKLTYEAGIKIWTDLGFDPIITPVYEDPALSEPNTYFEDENVMAVIEGMFPTMAPDYAGELVPDATIFGSTICGPVIEDGADPAESLANLSAELLAGAE